jgi:hypothetical protein
VNKQVEIGLLFSIVAVLVLGLSGCETISNQASGKSDLLGTWQGSAPFSLMMNRGNSTITQITFTNGMAELTVVNDFGTRFMNCSYTASSGVLTLTPKYDFGRPGFNASEPPGNWSYPMNGTRPNWNGTNGSRPPFNGSSNRSRPSGDWSGWQNGTAPGNGSWPGRQQQLISFNYRFDDLGVLYLDSSMFTKVS